MSGKLVAYVTPVEVALVAATAKTVLQVSTNSGTNKTRALVKKIAITFDGTSTIAEPVIIRLVRQSTGAPGTGTSVNGVAVNQFADAILTTGTYNFSSEATDTDVIDVIEVHPQAGYSIIFPLGLEPVIPSSALLALKVTAPAAVNCMVSIWVEE